MNPKYQKQAEQAFLEFCECPGDTPFDNKWDEYEEKIDNNESLAENRSFVKN